MSDPQALVLIVDDQPRNLELVKSALSRDGFDVITAKDAAGALRCMEGRLPDLLLLDVVMPEVNGFQLCTQIKDNPIWKDIPVIFLSGDDHHATIRHGFEVGGVDYIRKPFNKDELLARVRTHVELKRTREHHAHQMVERNRVLNLIANEWHKPIQRIVLNSSRIREICEQLDGDTAAVLMDEAQSAERMLASIENFLQFKLTDGLEGEGRRDQFTSQSLADLVGRWYSTAKRKPVNMQLTGTSKPVPMTDVSFMARQIVDAVMSNAITFAPVGGRVMARITSDDDLVILQVNDDGPGFPEDYLANPFQPYHRQSTRSIKGASGLGFGLAAAKRAAHRCGADITLANHPEGGALVRVSFARVRKPESMDAYSLAAPASTSA